MPLALFMIGWSIYAAGFIWSLIVKSESADREPEGRASSDPVYFPYYVTLVGGPLIYVLGVLYAIVPLSVLPGIVSATAWCFVTVLNSLYIASVSWIMYESGQCLNTSETGSDHLNIRIWLLFIGTVIALVSWCLLLILALFYKNKNDQTQNVNHSREFLADKKQNCAFQGLARALSALLVILSAVGWCVFVSGYHQELTLHNDIKSYQEAPLSCDIFHNFSRSMTLLDDSNEPVVIAVFISGPLLFLTSLLLAGCSGKSSTLSVVAAVLHVLFVTSAGYIIIHMIICLLLSKSASSGYMLWGLVASLTSMTFVSSLIPFYRDFKGSHVYGTAQGIAPRPRDLNESPETLRDAVMPPPSAPQPVTAQSHVMPRSNSPPPDYASAQNMMRAGDLNEQQPLLPRSTQQI